MPWDYTLKGMYRSAVEDSCDQSAFPALSPPCCHLVVCRPLLTRLPPPPIRPPLIQVDLIRFGPPGGPWPPPAGLVPPLPFWLSPPPLR